MTRKIHPQDSVRLTLNCEAGTLSLDVNGVDQGVVFSNVPPEVHPAVCFYGCAKSVRLVELKRIYSDSDGDTSDSEDESDEEGGEGATCRGGEEKQAPPLSQRPLQQQQQQQQQQEQEQQHPEERRQAPVVSAEDSNNSDQVGTSVSPGVEPRGNAGDRSNAGKHARRSHSNLRRRKSGREEAVSSFIRGVCASSPSRGLLASLANLAQWYVPRCEEDTERDEYGATEQRSDVEEGEGDRMNRLSETVDSAHAVSRSMAGNGSYPTVFVYHLIYLVSPILACASHPSRHSSSIGFCCSAVRKLLRRGSLVNHVFPSDCLTCARYVCFISFSFQPRPLRAMAAGALPGVGSRLISRPAGISGANH